MESRENSQKYISLFNYLHDFAKLREKTVRSFENYESYVSLADIPDKKGYDTILNHMDDEEFAKPEFWIKISKPPKEPEFIFPQKELRKWLDETQLKNTNQTPQILETIIEGDKELFHSDFPEVLDLYNSYIETIWKPWAEAYKKYSHKKSLYTIIYNMHNKYEKFNEEFQLLLGIGCFYNNKQDSTYIKRHILVADASIDFNPDNGVFFVQESPEGVKLRIESDMLDDTYHSNLGKSQHKLENDIKENELQDDPFNSQIHEALTSFANLIAPNCNYIKEFKFNDQIQTDDPKLYFAPYLILRKRSINTFSAMFNKISLQIQEQQNSKIEMLDQLFNNNNNNDDDNTIINNTIGENKEYKNFFEKVYFTKPANEEQKKVLDYLKTKRQILIQGPPGTGKSHTIANLIGHLLAHDKKILITAKTKRALVVIKDKLPDNIKALCVNLLGNDKASNIDLEKSIYKIMDKINDQNAIPENSVIEEKEKKVSDLFRKRAKLYNEITNMKEKEWIDHSINEYFFGTIYTITKQITEIKKHYSWFKDMISNNQKIDFETLSLQYEEFYRLTQDFKQYDDLSRFSKTLPENELLISCNDLEKYAKLKPEVKFLFNKIEHDDSIFLIEGLDKTSLEGLNGKIKIVSDTLNRLFNSKDEDTSVFFRELLSGEKTKIQSLYSKSKTLINSKNLEKLDQIQNEFEFSYPDDISLKKLLSDTEELLKQVSSGKKLKGSKLFKNSEIKERWYIKEKVSVNGSLCDTLEELEHFREFIQIKLDFENLSNAWKPYTEVEGSLFDKYYYFEKKIDKLKKAMDCFDDYETINRHLNMPINLSNHDTTRKLIELAQDKIRYHIALLDFQKYENKYNKCLQHLKSLIHQKESHVINEWLHESVESADPKSYSEILDKYQKVLNDKHRYNHWITLSSELKKIIPQTVELTLNGLELQTDNFDELGKIFASGQAVAYIKNLNNTKLLSDNENEIQTTNKQIQEYITEIASDKAWGYLKQNLTLQVRSSLTDFIQAIKKIGKGKGKKANVFRKLARKNLNEAKVAVPAWIMPLYRIADTVSPYPESFDFVIIDEASQIGPDALFLLYIAKNIIIVGDDKQTAPEYVGVTKEQVDDLLKKHLSDFNDRDFYGSEFSFFDHAFRFCSKQGTNMITLREHFRCMPEIIEFSNKNYYAPFDRSLYPMRQYSEKRLEPLADVFVKEGYCKGRGPSVSNKPEAEALVDKMIECDLDSTYDGMSFGVVVLQGNQQKIQIEKLLIERMGPQRMEKRDIIVGKSADFQGDERDVMFLSLVVSREYKTTALTKLQDERRFNVAASRAKNQMWLFHSITLEDIPNHDDQRYLLLQHYKSYQKGAFTQVFNIPQTDRSSEEAPKPFGSWFEVDIYNDILKKGYQAIPQYKVGNYRIDFAVMKKNGEKIAVECDGDIYHEGEQIKKDIERQKILERCGWRFFRVYASEYYLEGPKSLELLWKMLESKTDLKPRISNIEITEPSLCSISEQIPETKNPTNKKQTEQKTNSKSKEVIQESIPNTSIKEKSETNKIVHDDLFSMEQWFKEYGKEKLSHHARHPAIISSDRRKIYDLWIKTLKNQEITNEDIIWYYDIYKKTEG